MILTGNFFTEEDQREFEHCFDECIVYDCSAGNFYAFILGFEKLLTAFCNEFKRNLFFDSVETKEGWYVTVSEKKKGGEEVFLEFKISSKDVLTCREIVRRLIAAHLKKLKKEKKI